MDNSKSNEVLAKSPFSVTVDSGKPHPYKIGANYFIRTVTFHYTGKLTHVFEQELVLENCAWIPDDGRFSDALKNGVFNEVEPYPATEPVMIGRGAIVDAQVFDHPLPTEQK